MSTTIGSGQGLRERNKLKRRNAILDAALTILDDEPGVHVTVDRIAEIAELSPATVYNLVGGRDEIMRAVAVRYVEGVRATGLARVATGRPRSDALWPSRIALDLGSDLLIERSGAHRRLFAYMGGIDGGAIVLHGSDGRPLEAADVHIATMRNARRAGVIRRSLDPVILGSLVANGYIGTLLRWSYGGIDDTHLSLVNRLTLVSVAASASTAGHRAGFEREMATLNRQLSTTNAMTGDRP